jgi:protocatechuate 3,4-dioxygenase beta subunit
MPAQPERLESRQKQGGRSMNRRRAVTFLSFAVAAALLAMPAALAAKKKDPEQGMRSVQGTVTDSSDNPVDGAVVQLKNTKTLQIRSFITKDHGAYYFHGLNPDVDFELRAEYQGMTSAVRTLSTFDSRKQAVLNLKLTNKK